MSGKVLFIATRDEHDKPVVVNINNVTHFQPMTVPAIAGATIEEAGEEEWTMLHMVNGAIVIARMTIQEVAKIIHLSNLDPRTREIIEEMEKHREARESAPDAA